MSSESSDGEFVASEDLSSGSDDKSESETLAELEKVRSKAGRATKKTKKTKRPTVASAKKKMPTKKKKAPTTTDDRDKKRSTSFIPEELLLVAKAFMKVCSNAKLGTDKKMEKFWEDIHIHYNELVTTNNKSNESSTEYIPVECRNIKTLRNCWQRRLQPAVQKFAGVSSRNKPLWGTMEKSLLEANN